jgi:hypothetical protein
VPNIELTAVFYLNIPDNIDADDVTLEVGEDGLITFFADGEEIADHTALEGFETESVFVDDDAADANDEDED